MKDKLNLLSIIISSVVASITIVVAIFAWIYVLQVLAKSGLYGVGDVDTISFFASSNFASIGYESMMAIVGLIMSKHIIITMLVIIGCVFLIQSAAVLGAYFDEKIKDKIHKNNNKSSRLSKLLVWIWTKYKVSIIFGIPFLMLFYMIIVVFLSNVYLIPVIQESIVNKNKNSRYCNVITNQAAESQVLRVNLDNNYKLSWTYYGLVKTTVNDTDPYYPNKLNDKKREELINSYCK